MKITAFLLLAATLHVSAKGFAQHLTLSEKNAPLEKIFSVIKEQTGYQFWIEAKLLSSAKPVDITVKNKPLTEVLDLLFKDQPLTYNIVGKIIVVKDKPVRIEAPVPIEEPQPDPITGLVLDEKTQEPIAGASIVVKGQTQGVKTNDKGQFSITANSGNTLVITYVGYTPREVVIGTQRYYRITLEMTNESMKDIVVTGMFTRKASSFTGATTTFNQEELLKVGSVNVLQSLRNLDPAFQVIDNMNLGSDPNAIPNIQLRGQTGLPDLRGEYATNPNAPLFILDGFETTIQKVLDLDMYRVKSINVLKDAASKAIYGSRAANGVVVIETMRPQAGKLRFSYNTNITLQAPDLSSYDLTNAAEKLEVELAAGIYSNATVGNSQYILKQRYEENLRLVQSGVNTDWLSKPLQNGWGQRHSIRAEGGDQSFRYGVDLMYNKVTGVMKGSGRTTLTGAIDLTYRTRNVSVNNILTIANNRSDNSPWGAFSQYAAMNPYLPYQDENGRILKVITSLSRVNAGAGGAIVNEAVYNPAYNSTLKVMDYSKYLDITNNLSIDWRILPGLRALANLSVTKQEKESHLFLPADHTMFTTSEFSGDGAARKGRYTKGDGSLDVYAGRLLLNYTRNIGLHYIAINGGGDYSSNSSIFLFNTVEGFPNDRLDFPSLGLQYLLNSRPTGSESTVKDMSGLVSGNYSYDDRYLFDVSYRATQSSLYGKDNPWGQFWSAGIGWNAHKEAFLANSKVINQLRLRATNGYTGSQNFNSSISKSTYSYYLQNAYAGFGNGAQLIGLANPALQWQRKQDMNVGTDIALFNRLNLRFDYYISNTDGLVTDITLPPSAGFDTYKANLGKAENKGFDLRADYKVWTNNAKKASLVLFVLASHNKNTIKEISNSLKAWNQQQDATSSNNAADNKTAAVPRVRFVEGQSMNAIWAVPSLGIDPATGREVYLKKDGSVTYTWNANDQIAAGDALPKVSGNFGFNLIYGGWQVNTSFRFQYGGQMYNSTLVSKVENANVYQNVDRRVLTGRWRKPGDISFFKDVANTTTTQLSTRFVEDNDQLNFASLNITYDLDKIARVRSWGFSRLRAGFNMNEVFVISTVQQERGLEYPFARNFQFTLQASF
ncbi:SusC/RagA family TonB-linked outer membrane protein [Pseudoflavitalea sp. X16]|uniref:SusC/RagA family TonB-linked outer membrane protein n=1 Tax=Paraflavitalea devenefica TaxID=2716334 RepID=UPI00141E2C56|nr:SusC/RagA family TonB-linked outer membrane protein [Paraflavitalea devenefica]NII29070.1 SusC/RagA family TonB-linked outer membrane protein [Paraflavitalea devenefica]